MNLRCRSAVQPAWRLRVGAGTNCGGSGAGTMSALWSMILSFVAMNLFLMYEEQCLNQIGSCRKEQPRQSCLGVPHSRRGLDPSGRLLRSVRTRTFACGDTLSAVNVPW